MSWYEESRCLRSNILWTKHKKRLVIAEDDVCYRKFTELYESGFFFSNLMRYLATRERFVKSM